MEKPVTTGSYIWEVPGKDVSVRLSLEVVERLGAAVMQGFNSHSRRGIEKGGLLLGRTRRHESEIVVEIDDFEALESEHAVGPSYLLSGTDWQTLAERLAWHKRGGRSSVVGFYRSHTRKGFAIGIEDVNLMSGYFTKSSDVFLLIQANHEGPATAGFCIWERRKIRSHTPYLQFPFNAAELASEAQETPAQAGAQPYAAPAARMRVAAGLARFRVDLRPPPKWIAAALVLMASLGAGILQRNETPQAAAGVSQPRARQVSVSAPELPRPVLAAVPKPAPEPVIVTVRQMPPPRAIALPRRVAEAHRSIAQPAPEPVVSLPAPAPAVAAAALPPPSLPVSLPGPTAPLPGAAAASPQAGETAIAPPSKMPDRFLSVMVEPVSKRRKRSDFVPPSPIRDPLPDIPADVRRRLKNKVPIDVKVYVDPSGKVEYAELLSDGTGAHQDLASLAVFSSRRWEFVPAHSGDQKVPGEVILRFRFGPQTH